MTFPPIGRYPQGYLGSGDRWSTWAPTRDVGCRRGLLSGLIRNWGPNGAGTGPGTGVRTGPAAVAAWPVSGVGSHRSYKEGWASGLERRPSSSMPGASTSVRAIACRSAVLSPTSSRVQVGHVVLVQLRQRVPRELVRVSRRAREVDLVAGVGDSASWVSRGSFAVSSPNCPFGSFPIGERVEVGAAGIPCLRRACCWVPNAAPGAARTTQPRPNSATNGALLGGRHDRDDTDVSADHDRDGDDNAGIDRGVSIGGVDVGRLQGVRDRTTAGTPGGERSAVSAHAPNQLPNSQPIDAPRCVSLGPVVLVQVTALLGSPTGHPTATRDRLVG